MGLPKVGAALQTSTFGISFAESSIAIEHYRKFEYSYFKIPAFGNLKPLVAL